MAANPYQPPRELPPETTGPPSPQWQVSLVNGVAWLAVSFPLLLVLACHLSWLGAWWILGEQPVPMRDDPKDIDTPLAPLFFAAIWLLILWPIGLVAGILGAGWLAERAPVGSLWRRLLVPGHVILCALTMGLLFWDPLRVAEWLID